jgi:hypothetical protein
MKAFLLDLAGRISSRKFLLAVLGSLAVFGLDLSGEQIAAITAIILAYTGVEGYADIKERQLQ